MCAKQPRNYRSSKLKRRLDYSIHSGNLIREYYTDQRYAVALQIRRGTEAQRSNSSFIPLIGEPIFTTDEKKLYIGDGQTPGGISVGTGQSLSDLSDVELEADTVRTITSLVCIGNVVTVTTTEPHGFATDDILEIAVTAKTEINGFQTVTLVTATTFSFNFTLADFDEVSETGTATYRSPDESVLGYNSATGKWTEQEYVYNLGGLGDVQISNPKLNDIIQYSSTPVGDITLDADGSIVSSGVEDPGDSITAGQTWTQTGTISFYENRPFTISFNI